MKNKTLISPPKSLSRSFTLIELIVVIIIVGILAAVGISQYSLMVEKGRTAEAKVHIGTMRNLTYEYYLNNGTLTGMQGADVGVDGACHSTDFYAYSPWTVTSTWVTLVANRCASGGKTPNASRGYLYYLQYYPGTGQSDWHCQYTDTTTSCFGLPI